MQRYIERFPAGGEIIIFDRSWYNRAGVEYVMGFCTEAQHQRFLDLCPQVEKYIVDGGVRLNQGLAGRFWYARPPVDVSWMWMLAFGLYVREDENARDEDV